MPQPILIEFVADLEGVNQGVDALEKLGLVDKKVADEFRKASTAYADHNKKMQETGQKTETAKIELQGMIDTIKKMPKEIISQTAQKSVTETGVQVEKTATKAERMTRTLRSIREEMQKLEMAGQKNSARFRDLQMQAARFEDQIADTQTRIKILASDTKNLDGALSLATGLAGGFAAAQGASALFGQENENLMRSLMKVQGALALVSGLTAVADTINKDSAFTIVILGGAQNAWNKYMAQSIGLMRAMKIAAVGLGLGALIVGIWAAVEAWKAYQERQEEIYADHTRLAKINEEVAGSINSMAVELDGFVRKIQDENTTNEEKQGILKIVNDRYSDQLGTFNSIDELETKFIERAPAYIQVLHLRAQAQAALNLAMAEQEILMKNELPSAIQENIKWYDYLFSSLTAIGGANVDVTGAIEKSQNRINDANDDATQNLQFYLNKFTEFTMAAQNLVDTYGFEAKKQADATAKVVRDIWAVVDPVETIPTPDQLTNEIVEPGIKVVENFFWKLKKLREESAKQNSEDLAEQLQELQTNYERRAFIARETVGGIMDISNAAKQNELQNLEEQLEAGRISQDEYKKQSSQIKTELAKQQKAFALFQAALAIPQAFLTGLIQGGPPLGAVYAGLATLNLVAIAVQKIPKFAKGTRSVEGGTPGQDSVLAMLMPGERVTRTSINKEYTPILDAIDDRKIPAHVLNAIANRPDFVGLAIATEGRNGSGGGVFGMDYDQIRAIMEGTVGKIPIERTSFDEDGITRYFINRSRQIEYFNKRYSAP